MFWALSLDRLNAGNNSAARMAIMAMTTRSSIKVNPIEIVAAKGKRRGERVFEVCISDNHSVAAGKLQPFAPLRRLPAARSASYVCYRPWGLFQIQNSSCSGTMATTKPITATETGFRAELLVSKQLLTCPDHDLML